MPPPHLAAALGVPRERFFCRHDGHAAVLPGAKCRVEFVFTSKLPGAFLESWELHTTPPTTADGGAAATLQLRGVALAAPPGKAASVMEATLAKRQVRHAVEDILLTSVVKAAIDRVDARIAAPPAAAPSAEAAKYELWQSANAHRGLYYDAAMWHAFDAAASEIAPLTYEPGAWDGDVSKLERAAAALPARSAERAAAVARVGSPSRSARRLPLPRHLARSTPQSVQNSALSLRRSCRQPTRCAPRATRAAARRARRRRRRRRRWRRDASHPLAFGHRSGFRRLARRRRRRDARPPAG